MVPASQMVTSSHAARRKGHHIKGTGVMEITLPKLCFWWDPFSHCKACFRCALVWRLAASSNNWNAPCSSTAKKRWIHILSQKDQPVAVKLESTWRNNVQCNFPSWVRLLRLYDILHMTASLCGLQGQKDLQFVTITAACIWRIATGGLLHWNSGMINVPHSNRHHPILSTLRDMENASADNVDLTTLEIFFDASVFTSVSRGSWYPKTPNLALAFWNVIGNFLEHCSFASHANVRHVDEIQTGGTGHELDWRVLRFSYETLIGSRI